MTAPENTTSSVIDQPLPVSLFKKSLREWQAQWKADQLATSAEPRRTVGRKSRVLRSRKAALPS
jgi:hypothetical protein